MKPTLLGSTLALLLACGAAKADIIQIPATSFVAGSGLITFSEFPLNTQNPTYAPATYGGGANSPTVTFGGFFTGQSLGTAATCPAGAALTGCVVGNPTGPLSLAANSPLTFIANDGAMPTSPILSGSPLFNGPIAIRFSVPQAGVGLIGGYFDALNSTAITAYGTDGSLIGQVTNSQIGDEFLGLVTSDGSATISGLLFHLVGNEPAGFDVDNIRFGTTGQVVIPTLPEPASMTLLCVGLAGIAMARRRRKA